MKYDLAIERSLTALESSAESKELRAALTHWFQYPYAFPPFFTENHKRRVLSEQDGAEILIAQKGDRPKRLSVEEAMQLQGYKNAAWH